LTTDQIALAAEETAIHIGDVRATCVIRFGSTSPPHDIHKVRVMLTLMDGKVTYRAADSN
jgi:hypothetical protein